MSGNNIKGFYFSQVESSSTGPKYKVMNQIETILKSIEEFENRLADAEQKYVAAYNGRKKWTDILKNWVAFGERVVVDVYPHTVDIPGTSIIVKGYINGYLWWKDEKPSAEDIKSMCTDEE